MSVRIFLRPNAPPQPWSIPIILYWIIYTHTYIYINNIRAYVVHINVCLKNVDTIYNPTINLIMAFHQTHRTTSPTRIAIIPPPPPQQIAYIKNMFTQINIGEGTKEAIFSKWKKKNKKNKTHTHTPKHSHKHNSHIN